MKKLFALSLLSLTLVAGFIAGGCASAHKKADTIHENWEYTIAGTNSAKPVSLLTHHEIWSDRYKGGGSALLADPKASQIVSGHTNQTALGGSSTLNVGDVESTVSTNGLKVLADGVNDLAAKLAPLINPTAAVAGGVLSPSPKAAAAVPTNAVPAVESVLPK